MDDEPTDIWNKPNPMHGTATTSQGVVVKTDLESFGGPYVIVEDGNTLYNLDLAEVTEILS